jgi:hypothetical protein
MEADFKDSQEAAQNPLPHSKETLHYLKTISQEIKALNELFSKLAAHGKVGTKRLLVSLDSNRFVQRSEMLSAFSSSSTRKACFKKKVKRKRKSTSNALYVFGYVSDMFLVNFQLM